MARQLEPLSCRVVYLFFGKERSSDIESAMRGCLRLHNHEASLACTLDFVSIDMLPGGSDHDILPKSRRDDFLDRIARQEFNLVLVAPP